MMRRVGDFTLERVREPKTFGESFGCLENVGLGHSFKEFYDLGDIRIFGEIPNMSVYVFELTEPGGASDHDIFSGFKNVEVNLPILWRFYQRIAQSPERFLPGKRSYLAYVRYIASLSAVHYGMPKRRFPFFWQKINPRIEAYELRVGRPLSNDYPTDGREIRRWKKGTRILIPKQP